MSQVVLLLGCQGQLGTELQAKLAPWGEVIAVGRETFDLARPESIRQLMQTVKPQIAINAAAYTAVDRAESEPELARAVNAIAPGILAEETKRSGATLIHISTDYVFDGSQSHPYLETDATRPLGVYGQSKRAGEVAVQTACDRYIILRTAWVYGVHGKGNFVKTMLRLGAEREEIRVVADQVGSPTWTQDIADAIAQLVAKGMPDEPHSILKSGIYHYTSSGVASWYDFAVAIFEEVRSLGMPLKVKRIFPITTADYPTPARRPAYSVLSCAKISAVLGGPPPHWRQGLRQMLRDFNH